MSHTLSQPASSSALRPFFPLIFSRKPFSEEGESSADPRSYVIGYQTRHVDIKGKCGVPVCSFVALQNKWGVLG
jgi:hypothetical protein